MKAKVLKSWGQMQYTEILNQNEEIKLYEKVLK
jgi:hypothetical protein